jgi:hypothetical protein
MINKISLTGTQNSGVHGQVFVGDEWSSCGSELASRKALSQHFLEGSEKITKS